jgi:hypothetical protein
LATPDQLRVKGAASKHVPDPDRLNCWRIGGTDGDPEELPGLDDVPLSEIKGTKSPAVPDE